MGFELLIGLFRLANQSPRGTPLMQSIHHPAAWPIKPCHAGSYGLYTSSHTYNWRFRRGQFITGAAPAYSRPCRGYYRYYGLKGPFPGTPLAHSNIGNGVNLCITRSYPVTYAPKPLWRRSAGRQSIVDSTPVASR